MEICFNFFCYVLSSLFILCTSFFFGLHTDLFTLWFFRNPERKTPEIENSIISSADGKVCLIDNACPPEETGMGSDEMLRICVFMNVFNVHINRSPIAGKINKIVYKEGHFFNASLDKASEKNERSSIVLSNQKGTEIVVVQIAGLIARRILGFVSTNQNLDQGERYGLIRFGSRVDIYLPLNSNINCNVGDKVIAGETLLATLADNL
jgi:phosphatidylserine decarboxylase